MSEVAISIANLTVSYQHRPVLRGITAEIFRGELTAVIGPNGAGKSTLLQAILGLIPRDSGKIEVFGENVSACRHRIAYIPQKEHIDWNFPAVVFDVVMMGRYHKLRWFRRASRVDRECVDNALEQVGMREFAKRQIRLLSGGQQQRVFIARALVQEADILFLDEPFVGVDATTENAIFTLIIRLKEQGKAVVIINHDLGILHQFDRLMLINKQLIAIGPPSQVNTPENLRHTYGGRLPMVEQAEMSLLKARKSTNLDIETRERNS